MARTKIKAKASRKFLLLDVLTEGSTLRPSIQVGMNAFLNTDKQLIAVGERARIGDSLDLDSTLRPAFPNAHRWDYIFSVSDTKRILALEPHSANDSEISVVIAKKRNAADYLRAHLLPKHWVSEWLWVSHGKSSFSKTEKATRALASAGIRYVGRFVVTLGEA